METNLHEDATLAAILLASESHPEDIDAVYIHGLTDGMLKSHRILEQGADLARLHRCPIAFNGSDGAAVSTPLIPQSAWPGASYYMEQLVALGFDEKNLIPAPGPGLHTRHEADQLASLAKEREWKTVLALSTGYYAVRAMSCHVAAMYTIDYPFAVYFAQPKDVDWDHPMKGSQGKHQTTPREEARVEIGKILHNWEKGAGDAWRQSYSAPPGMLFQYLKDRPRLV